MSRANRLGILAILGPVVLSLVLVHVASAAPERRLSAVILGAVVVVVSTLGGRWFFVWAQKAMIKKWAVWEAQGRTGANHSGRLAVVFAASVLGAILGPTLGQVISAYSALLLGAGAFLAFVTGWAFAPDLSAEVRKKYWQQVAAGKTRSGPGRH